VSIIKKVYIQSANKKIYIELGYPKKIPAPAVVIAHGLRSYYSGFLNMFAKSVRENGYISVKFHFLGTGKSEGLFEEKSSADMLQNYQDVISFLKKQPKISKIGVVGRSNAGSLAILAGPDPNIKAYAFLAPPAYYSKTVSKFIKNAKIKGKFFYHKSFKRLHTKGEGRLPLNFVEELKKYDRQLLDNAKKMKNVILFQSTADETVLVNEGHFDYWKENLPEPKKMVLVKGGNHSFKGHKKYVINESIKWLDRFLK
jgi:dienelactone hydrolase